MLGVFIAFVYKKVMTSFNFSIPILYTVIYVCISVSLIMIIVANELVRAFTLLGAFAVIRFRTPIKDARDGAFIFIALAAGMGVGVGLYLETALGVLLIGLCILFLHWFKFGLVATKETLVRFVVPGGKADSPAAHKDVFERHLKSHSLVNVRSLQEGRAMELTFYVRPKRATDMIEFSRALTAVPGVGQVSLIVCEDDEVPDNVF